jgi:hypothetical protein
MIAKLLSIVFLLSLSAISYGQQPKIEYGSESELKGIKSTLIANRD